MAYNFQTARQIDSLRENIDIHSIEGMNNAYGKGQLIYICSNNMLFAKTHLYLPV